MASLSGSIHHPCQSPITCDICEGTEDVDSYCLMCKGPMCSTCKGKHTQTPMFRKHRIVPIAEGLRQQEPEEECIEHPSYICCMHCNVCRKLICSKCISSGEHSGHDIGGIEAALQRVQQEIKEYQDALEIRFEKYKTEEKNITQDKADCKIAAMSVKSYINDKRAELIREIHTICDDMISKFDDEEKQQTLQIDKSLKKVQETIKEIEQLMTESKEALTKHAYEMTKFNQEKPSLSLLEIQDAPKTHLATFVPGTMDRVKLAEQIGNLVPLKHLRIDTAIVHRANCESKIKSIKAVNENQSWITASNSLLRLVDTDGREVRSMNIKFNVEDFAVTTLGDIIVTDPVAECIRIMAQTGQVTKTINTSSSQPTGICLSNNNQEIIVCVNASDGTCSKLLVYSGDGKEIRTIKYTNKPVKKYTSQRITQNNRGDYCVAHHHHKKVYVVDTNGGLRWTYIYDRPEAGEVRKKSFVPHDICNDIYNNLIISDINNHKIHMLDGEGKFLRFMLTEQDGLSRPTGICIDKEGRLWIGEWNGGLYIMKYLK